MLIFMFEHTHQKAPVTLCMCHVDLSDSSFNSLSVTIVKAAQNVKCSAFNNPEFFFSFGHHYYLFKITHTLNSLQWKFLNNPNNYLKEIRK